MDRAHPENAGRFRKKPVVIEAYEFQNKVGEDRRPDWIKQAHTDGVIAFHNRRDGPPHLLIKTLEGEMRADVGDWVIKGIKGELYPCKPDIFAATYEEAPAPTGAQSGPRVTPEEGMDLEGCLAASERAGDAMDSETILTGLDIMAWTIREDIKFAERSDRAAPLTDDSFIIPRHWMPHRVARRWIENLDNAAALIRRLAGERDEARAELKRHQDSDAPCWTISDE